MLIFDIFIVYLMVCSPFLINSYSISIYHLENNVNNRCGVGVGNKNRHIWGDMPASCWGGRTGPARCQLVKSSLMRPQLIFSTAVAVAYALSTPLFCSPFLDL